MEEYRKENYVVDVGLFNEREEVRTEELEERYHHQVNVNGIPNKEDEEDETDLHGNVDEDFT